MVSAVLALVGALTYGSADFLGGLAARRLRAVVVTATSALSGLLLLLLLLPLTGGMWTAADAVWGALSGIAGAVAIGLLYACLAVGPMSVLSPVTAVVSALAPMLWGIVVSGERLAPSGYVGLGLALVAIVLVAFLPGERITRPSARALGMAVGSGLAIGTFLVLLDQTGPGSGVIPLVMNRTVNALLTGTIVLTLIVRAARRGAHPADAVAALPGTATRNAWLLALLCGLADAAANVLLLLALRGGGDLAVVAALTALYPAGTVLLAAVVLRERIAPAQWCGLALALGAGVLLALA